MHTLLKHNSVNPASDTVPEIKQSCNPGACAIPGYIQMSCTDQSPQQPLCEKGGGRTVDTVRVGKLRTFNLFHLLGQASYIAHVTKLS